MERNDRIHYEWHDITSGGNTNMHLGHNYSNTTTNYHGPGGRRDASQQQQAAHLQSQASRRGPSGKKQLRKEDYTVGWICALPVPEWRASRLLLDEEHEDIRLGIGTNNQYVYGEMHGHNIVMGCLPAAYTGKAAAAGVASEMMSTFPLLRFGLLVGVGGGAPSDDHDVRLGDVVVGYPDREREFGGVVQYDYGKAIEGKGFQRNGAPLAPPPRILLNGVAKLQSTPRGTSKFWDYLKSYDEDEYPDFPNGRLIDRLFPPDCPHVENAKNCDRCGGPDYKDTRNARKSPIERVHYGSIASADTLMKDAKLRNKIGKQYDILCFEMEAAGLVPVFPCLVVRGICDYSDSHKNKSWQPYAATAAAAWAKDLLRNMHPADVSGSETIGRMTQQSN